MNEITNLFKQQAAGADLRSDPHLDRQPGRHPVVVVRRDQEARDDQLPHLQAGARRPVLRAHLRADQGLRVLVRQVQAHEVQGPDLREVRRRGDARQGSPRAHGPHRARRAGRPHLVPEVAAVAHRPAARHDAQGSRARALLRELHRHRARHDAVRREAAADRGAVQPGDRGVRPGQLHRRHRRGGDPRAACRRMDLPKMRDRAAPGDRRGDDRAQAQEARQAPQGDRGLHRIGQPSGVDDPDRGAGDPAGAAPARAARRRPLRHLRPQRSLSPRHQPQQPPEAADGAARARHHHPQREADAAGSRSTRCSTTAGAAASSPAPTSVR